MCVQETRYRKRYLDAIVNPFVRDIFTTRAAIIRHIRRFFDDRGFLEVCHHHLCPGLRAAARCLRTTSCPVQLLKMSLHWRL